MPLIEGSKTTEHYIHLKAIWKDGNFILYNRKQASTRRKWLLIHFNRNLTFLCNENAIVYVTRLEWQGMGKEYCLLVQDKANFVENKSMTINMNIL